MLWLGFDLRHWIVVQMELGVLDAVPQVGTGFSSMWSQRDCWALSVLVRIENFSWTSCHLPAHGPALSAPGQYIQALGQGCSQVPPYLLISKIVFSLINGPCMCSVAQSCPTLCNPMDCSRPGSSVHGILQTRILEWVAISSSRGSSRPRYQTHISCLLHWQASSLPLRLPGKPKGLRSEKRANMSMGSP